MMKRILFIFTLLMLILCFSIGASCAELEDYMLTDETIIANAPVWDNSDFPTSFIFYNIENQMYYVATSASCCGYKDNAYINTVDNTFRLGNGSFRLYYWRYTNEWRYQNEFNSIDLSIFKLVSYNDAISKLYIDDSEVGSTPTITISDYTVTFPNQTEYIYKGDRYEEFIIDGFSVVANMTDGTKEDITNKCSITYPEFTEAGTYQLIYSCNDGNYEGSVQIMLYELRMQRFYKPDVTTYNYDDEIAISYEGMKLLLYLFDGSDVIEYDVTNGLVVESPDNFVLGANEVNVSYPRTDYKGSFDIYIADGITDEEDISNATLGQQILNGLEDIFNSIFGVLISLVEFLYNLVIKLGDFVVSLYDFVVKLPDFINSILALFYDSNTGETGVILKVLNNFFEHNTYSNGILAIFMAMLFFGLYNGTKAFITWLVQWL